MELLEADEELEDERHRNNWLELGWLITHGFGLTAGLASSTLGSFLSMFKGFFNGLRLERWYVADRSSLRSKFSG